MKRNATLCNDQTKARPNIMNQVTNRDGRRVRGIWFRNGVYYAQLRVAGNVKQIPLQDAGTVAQAVTARQVLKGQITAGTFPPAPPQPQSPPPPESEALPVAGELDVSDHSIPAAIKTYREERDALKKGDKKTGKRENSGLNKWVEFCNMRQEAKQPKPTHIADLDSKMLKNFAVWRRKKALAELEGKLEEGVTLDAEESGISGRTLDLDVMAIQKVVAWAVTEGWLEVAPVLHWDTLAEEPEKIRLMTSEELESFARANLVTEDSLAGLPKNTATSAPAMPDHLRRSSITPTLYGFPVVASTKPFSNVGATSHGAGWQQRTTLAGKSGRKLLVICTFQAKRPRLEAANRQRTAMWIFTRDWRSTSGRCTSVGTRRQIGCSRQTTTPKRRRVRSASSWSTHGR